MHPIHSDSIVTTRLNQVSGNSKMNMLLASSLFCCMLYAASYSFVVDVIQTSESDDFCDEGPPGRYCLPDLSGWHDCHVDPATGKMVDTINECAPKTRCACFYGPPCPGSLDDPCQPYRLPPPPPDKFTLYYNAKRRTCSPMGCHDTYYSGKEIQSLTEYKKRDDLYEAYWSSTFVLPGNGSSFIQTEVRWDEQICQSQQIKAFPESVIPPFFSYNGTVKLGYRLCEQWIWRSGGHNPGQGTSLNAYYISNQTNVKQHYLAVSGPGEDPYVPVVVEVISNSGPIGKTSLHSTINITSFLIGEVDEEQLELPSFCES